MQIEGILKSDIFFFVTTAAVIIVTFMSVIIGIYTIKILIDIRKFIKNIKFRYRFVEKFIKKIINR